MIALIKVHKPVYTYLLYDQYLSSKMAKHIRPNFWEQISGRKIENPLPSQIREKC